MQDTSSSSLAPAASGSWASGVAGPQVPALSAATTAPVTLDPADAESPTATQFPGPTHETEVNSVVTLGPGVP
jgi:hypothetical protein